MNEPEIAAELIIFADDEIEKGNYRSAINYLNKSIKIEPMNAEAHYKLGIAYYNLSERMEAIECFDEAIKINPNNESYFYSRANARIAIQNIEEASNYSAGRQLIATDDKKIKEFFKEEVAKVFKKSINDKLSNSYNSVDFLGAIDDYNKALEINPKFTSAQLKIGIAEVSLGAYQEAIDHFKDALKNHPKPDICHDLIGFVKYYKFSDYKGSLEEYTLAIGIDPKNPTYFIRRAESKRCLDDYQGAINDCTIAIKLDPTNYEHYFDRGYAKMLAEDDQSSVEGYQSAIDDLTIASELNQSDDNLFRHLGDMKLKMKDYKGAIDTYTKMMQIKDDHFGIYLCKCGKARKELGDLKGACEDWKKAARLGHLDARALLEEYCK